MILEWNGMGWNGIICGIGKRADLFASRYIHCVIAEGGDMRY